MASIVLNLLPTNQLIIKFEIEIEIELERSKGFLANSFTFNFRFLYSNEFWIVHRTIIDAKKIKNATALKLGRKCSRYSACDGFAIRCYAVEWVRQRRRSS